MLRNNFESRHKETAKILHPKTFELLTTNADNDLIHASG